MQILSFHNQFEKKGQGTKEVGAWFKKHSGTFFKKEHCVELTNFFLSISHTILPCSEGGIHMFRIVADLFRYPHEKNARHLLYEDCAHPVGHLVGAWLPETEFQR
jgi:hypothetical protein